MKERPILFSGPMVRALLAGTKMQTRRALKPQPSANTKRFFNTLPLDRAGFSIDGPITCPYGQLGDRLWVRETFQPLFADGMQHGDEGIDWGTGAGYAVRYPATDEIVEWVDGDDEVTSRCKPSIHMPRWASRLTLEITAVRVERLQDISRADAIAEGLDFVPDGAAAHGIKGLATSWSNDPRKSYRALWESLNGDDSWDANPFVWVIEFTRVMP